MKKRAVCLMLALSLLPLQALAGQQAESAPEETILQQEEAVYSSMETHVLSEAPMTSAMESFCCKLAEGARAIAAGETASTVIEVPDFTLTYTKEELGITGDTASYVAEKGEWEITPQAENAVKEKLEENLNVESMLAYLLLHYPYEFYWFDKAQGVSMPYHVVFERRPQTDITLSGFSVSFAVSQDYAVIEDNQYDLYTINTQKAQTAAQIAQKAQAVVNANAQKSDYEKLAAYRDYILDAVEYHTVAAESSGFPYGDPWQLIYVFDENPDTNVVCEGYAKAFQYLCDLTWTGDSPAVKCHLVLGTMTGGTGAGSHMWNIVTIGGQNYLVDITNCEASGRSEWLFLGGASGSVEGGYTATNGVETLTYTYDSDSLFLYGTELTLSATGYEPVIPGDLNGDSKCDPGDMQWLFERLDGAESFADDQQRQKADFNGDTYVNILDYQALYEHVLALNAV